MQDPSLRELREQIKNVMLPLLLKVFQLKIHASTEDAEESSIQKLKLLDKDIKTLMLWCQTCIKQMQEALNIDLENSGFKKLYPDPQNHFKKRWWHKLYKKFNNKSSEV
jgi:hypothetical protein